ncbi:MAG: ribosome biogenesis factor YjgA [Gammaproteobacteria bacterium]
MNTTHDTEEIKSKSQRKREMHALQALGEALVKLSQAELERIPLPADLREAVIEAQRIRQRGAHKRQLQYIGRLMRDVDPEPIQSGLDRLRHRDRLATAFLHRIERWRDRLLDDGDSALGELLETHPALDRQHLRQLMRNARKEMEGQKPPRAARELFRYLRDTLDDNGD